MRAEEPLDDEPADPADGSRNLVGLGQKCALAVRLDLVRPDQLGIVQGETLLVLGGAGSVGIIATQLAASCKATVIAVANPRDHELMRELGATPVPSARERRNA